MNRVRLPSLRHLQLGLRDQERWGSEGSPSTMIPVMRPGQSAFGRRIRRMSPGTPRWTVPRVGNRREARKRRRWDRYLDRPSESGVSSEGGPGASRVTLSGVYSYCASSAAFATYTRDSTVSSVASAVYVPWGSGVRGPTTIQFFSPGPNVPSLTDAAKIRPLDHW